jgi:hypothetical protein
MINNLITNFTSLLPLSVTIKMDYKENMENARYARNDETPLMSL